MTHDSLAQFSEALAARAAAAKSMVAAIRASCGRLLTGTIWRGDAIVASEQALPKGLDFETVLPGGTIAKAALAGRDQGTNVALLRLAEPVATSLPAPGDAETGRVALAFGTDGVGGATVRMGVVHLAGPEWHSRSGGRIDRRIVLDLDLAPAEEGGPVLDAAGALLGLSTLGPRGETLVIPAATVERTIPALWKDGRVARGWLGVAMQPVAVPDALRGAAGHTSGFMVMSTADGGPAAGAGVLAGDILVSLDGTPARSSRRIAAILGPESIGRKTELHLIRGGAVVSLEATIAERPAS